MSVRKDEFTICAFKALFYFSLLTNVSLHLSYESDIKCVLLKNCPMLYELFKTGTRKEEHINLLRTSHCGFDKHEPKVWCVSTSSLDTTTLGDTTTTSTGSNNGQSPINLLPGRDTCGLQASGKILSGEKTGLDEFPWMALLQYQKPNGALVFSCGASLISSRYVLTAAHCIIGVVLTRVGQPISVRLGEWDLTTEQDCITSLGYEDCNYPPQDIKIEDTIPHPGYEDASTDHQNDISLIRLSRDVKFNDFIRPICLPLDANEQATDGDRLYVAGWGRTEFASHSPVKLKLLVPVKSQSSCANTFKGSNVNIGQTQLCAGGELGKDSCNGDSGGPLMNSAQNDSSQYILEGIVSFGARCGTQGWPGIYTRVNQYLDWIYANVRP